MKIARRTITPGVPAVAMADIAFNLVLFFIMMAKTQDDSHLQWRPASTNKTQSAGNSTASVVIDRDDKLYFNGQQIGISQLRSAVEMELKDSPAGKRTVVLKIDKETTAQMFEPVVEAVSQAGGEMVHILQEQRG